MQRNDFITFLNKMTLILNMVCVNYNFLKSKFMQRLKHNLKKSSLVDYISLIILNAKIMCSFVLDLKGKLSCVVMESVSKHTNQIVFYKENIFQKIKIFIANIV